MKLRILTFLAILTLGFLTSCNTNDDSLTQNEAIAGTWNLKNVSGGLAGINIDYDQGDVIWSFNQTNNTLIVENNTTTEPESTYAGLDSGTYNYEIHEVDNLQTLFINNSKRGVIAIINANLIIDDGVAADGFITEFER